MSRPHRPLLSLENLVHSFELSPDKRLQLFKGLSLCLYPGESVAITGASGEGKSTLLHLIGGLEKACCDRQTWLENEGTANREEVGFIFQHFHLLEDLSVLDNVLLPLRLQHKRLSSHENLKALQMIERVGLKGREHQLCAQLSGGEKQRCALARALITSPKLILADEPTGNLDHETAAHIARLLFDTVKEFNCSLLLVTHDRNLSSHCDRIFKLENGHLRLLEA